MQFYDSQRRPIQLGQEIGAGGEAILYAVPDQPNRVAKIWRQPDPDRAHKLEAAIKNTPANLDQYGSTSWVVWPTTAITNAQGNTLGYMMPFVDHNRYRESQHFFNPRSRAELGRRFNTVIPDIVLIKAAHNIVRAASIIHDAGHVIGDVNEKNIFIDIQGNIALVDTDSIQINEQATGKIYRCTVARPEYLAPRLQGLSLRQIDRIPEDDNFAIPIIIFKLLFDGRHPYQSRLDPNSPNQVQDLADKIKAELFPYNEDNTVPDEYKIKIPEYRNIWDRLRPEVKTLFQRTYDPFYTRNQTRPTVHDWTAALDREIQLYTIQSTPQAPTTTAHPQSGPAPPPYPPFAHQGQAANSGLIYTIIGNYNPVLVPLLAGYAQQLIQKGIWSFQKLPDIPTTRSIKSVQSLEKCSDPLALLHVLVSISSSLDRQWTSQNRINPAASRRIIAHRNAVTHEQALFADPTIASQTYEEVQQFHLTLKALPANLPAEALPSSQPNVRTKPSTAQRTRHSTPRPNLNKPNPPSTATSQSQSLSDKAKTAFRDHPVIAISAIAIVILLIVINGLPGSERIPQKTNVLWTAALAAAILLWTLTKPKIQHIVKRFCRGYALAIATAWQTPRFRTRCFKTLVYTSPILAIIGFTAYGVHLITIPLPLDAPKPHPTIPTAAALSDQPAHQLEHIQPIGPPPFAPEIQALVNQYAFCYDQYSQNEALSRAQEMTEAIQIEPSHEATARCSRKRAMPHHTGITHGDHTPIPIANHDTG